MEPVEREYDVETLVHLNIKVRVRAEDPDEALRKAREKMEAEYPEAALVDPVNYEVA